VAAGRGGAPGGPHAAVGTHVPPRRADHLHPARRRTRQLVASALPGARFPEARTAPGRRFAAMGRG